MEVMRETLAVLALILSHEQLEHAKNLTGRAAEIINLLAQHIVQRSTRTALLAQEKEAQAAEYEREASRLEELHDVSGTPKRAFTQDARDGIDMLARISSSLTLSNTHTSSIVAAHVQDCLQVTYHRIQQLAAQRQELQVKQQEQLIASKLQRLCARHLETLEVQAAAKEEASRQAKHLHTMEAKNKNYRSQQKQLAEQLRDQLYKEELEHSKILELDQQVQAALSQQEAAQQQLESYLALPPDMAAAQLLLQQAQQALEQRREEYESGIVG